MASSNNNASGWVGWIGFAGFLMLFAGLFHIIEGIADLARNSLYVHSSGYVWVLDYKKWGWINIIGGILLIIAAGSLLRGGIGGRIFASFIVVLSMLAAVTSLPQYPVWSIIVLVVDALILHAILVHGNEVKKLS